MITESINNLNSHNTMTKEEENHILNNQLLFVKIRYKNFSNLILKNLKSYSF